MLERDRNILIKQFDQNQKELCRKSHELELELYQCQIKTCAAKVNLYKHKLHLLEALQK